MDGYTTRTGRFYALVPIRTLGGIEDTIKAEGAFLYRGKIKHWSVISNMSISTVLGCIRAGVIFQAHYVPN